MGSIGNILKKGVSGLIIGGILVAVARALDFPPVFQVMFFIYALLGAAVFTLLDAPSVKAVSGLQALVALIVFYVVISGAYIVGASLLPQYDPEDEKGKIEKILKAKRAATEHGKAEELLARAKALSDKADAIMAHLQQVGAGGLEPPAGGAKLAAPGADGTKPGATGGGATGDLVALGKEQWNLQECYNCHKLFGEGGKKRGPELDNIGNLLTAEQLKQKIIDPQSWMAEGFEKEYEKKKMPDKYKELMEDREIDALVTFLTTLKNPGVNTPKPIKKK
jgi:hypothetical protein